MVKKRKKSSSLKKKKTPTKIDIQEQLIENFVKMQKVMANLSVKFDNLSDNINKLLQLFEIAAKSFVQKQEQGTGENTDLLNKLDTLLDQNKTIAKGLTLVEEKIRHKMGEDITHRLPSVSMHKTEAERHGLYPKNMNGFGERPRPGKKSFDF